MRTNYFSKLDDFSQYIEEKVQSKNKDTNNMSFTYNLWFDNNANSFYLNSAARVLKPNSWLDSSHVSLPFTLSSEDKYDLQKFKDKYEEVQKYLNENFAQLNSKSSINYSQEFRASPSHDSAPSENLLKVNSANYIQSQLEKFLDLVETEKGYGVQIEEGRRYVFGRDIINLNFQTNVNLKDGSKGAKLGTIDIYYPGTEEEALKLFSNELNKFNKLNGDHTILLQGSKKENISYDSDDIFLKTFGKKITSQLEGRKKIIDPKVKISFENTGVSASYSEDNTDVFKATHLRIEDTQYVIDGIKKHIADAIVYTGQNVAIKDNTKLETKPLLRKKVVNSPIITTYEKTTQPVADTEVSVQPAIDTQQIKVKPEPEIILSSLELAKINMAELMEKIKSNPDFYKFAMEVDKAITLFEQGVGERASVKVKYEGKSIGLETKNDGDVQSYTMSKTIPVEYYTKYAKDEVKLRLEGNKYFTYKQEIGAHSVDNNIVRDTVLNPLVSSYNSLRSAFKDVKGEVDFNALKDFIAEPKLDKSIV